jgi:hypothetical protein
MLQRRGVCTRTLHSHNYATLLHPISKQDSMIRGFCWRGVHRIMLGNFYFIEHRSNAPIDPVLYSDYIIVLVSKQSCIHNCYVIRPCVMKYTTVILQAE